MNEMTSLLSFGLTAGIMGLDGLQLLLTVHNGKRFAASGVCCGGTASPICRFDVMISLVYN